MTSLPHNDQSCNTHLASLVAIKIVTQILNEAQDIVNKTNDSGHSWRYVWCQNKRNNELFENAELSGITDSKINDNEIKHNNVIVTSTPQKQIDTRDFNECGIIGQGDEDVQTRNFDLPSPSILIDCMMDSKNSQQEETFEGNKNGQNDLESHELLERTVTKLVESYIDFAINTACGDVLKPKLETNAKSIEKSNSSSYSLLDDAYGNEVIENEANFSEDIKYEEKREFCTTQLTKDMVNSDDMEETKKKDIDMYEKTYSTLNRDYDKFSEEEDFQEDQKSGSMQEVELPTYISSSENVATRSKPDHHLSLTITEEKKIAANSTKVSLLKRCRIRGSKFLSRLRSWWWKQRLIGKRKVNSPLILDSLPCHVYRASRTSLMPGMCPLSPKARKRSAGFLNHKVRSPSPIRMCAWKLSTVNEAIIHTYKPKEFELEFKSTAPVDE